MKKYNLINNSLGWLMFAIAAITYLSTIEPTASFWDCPEFISQGAKLEIGHPPGNPIFMLAARTAINFCGGDLSKAAVAVNSMSALLSALTILLLFWTITHLVKKLLVTDGEEDQMSLTQYLVIMGSGVVGALAYTWSDTFWFSAVEAEVYAFSSFCTALVFWLILKWENRADEPNSDRYLILIAYVIGVSVAVHLLNLLCIPAIVLVFYYKKFKNTTVKGSLAALAVAGAIIVFILWGLVPGFVKVAQWFELFFVNTLHMPYNTGVVIYTLLDFAVFAWALYELYNQQNATRIKVSVTLAVFISGMCFIGNGWIAPIVLLGGLVLYLFKFCRRIPVRILTLLTLSILVIFIGYSSYALILIRSGAKTGINQNAPDNVFSLSSYLSREQYGDTPLLYGAAFGAGIVYQENGQGYYRPVTKQGKALYAKEVDSPEGVDRYFNYGHDMNYKKSPEMEMLFPRMHDGKHAKEYTEWINMKGRPVEATTRLDREGNPIEHETKIKPTFLENLQFFLDYQMNYMYWRYFMWNFVGRQNDLQGSGEITHGNWISGIPIIDNIRLGDQSLLPADLGTGNKGHNVFFMLPLILGIIGLLWQAYAGQKGIEQFWVIFFLFIMTGVAIVFYLNQTPSQPRERDYAFAGSFYAYAIWIGMGVAGLWRLLLSMNKKKDKSAGTVQEATDKTKLRLAIASCVLGVLVPLQMVSQTWDDHDRSGRYPARDFGMNYLSSLQPNAIIFTNGDNDTFPLWYCQEVEGYRTDVRVVNLSYLTTEWYIDQMRYPNYDSAPLPMQAKPSTFAYGERVYNYFIDVDSAAQVPVTKAIEQLYGPDFKNNPWGLPAFKYPNMYIPVDADAVIAAGIVKPDKREALPSVIDVNLLEDKTTAADQAISSSGVMALDIISSAAAEGWKRPVYFAMTVPDSYYLGLSPYMRNTGMAYQVTPIPMFSPEGDIVADSDKAYDNIMNKFRWAGIDVAEPGSLYIDETVARMITTLRSSMTDLAYMLVYEGATALEDLDITDDPAEKKKLQDYANDRLNRARKVLHTMETKLPQKTSEYSVQMGLRVAQTYETLAQYSKNEQDMKRCKELLRSEVLRYGDYQKYYQSLSVQMYNRLSYNDMYIDQYYLPHLFYYYMQVDADGAEPLLQEMRERGVNVDRMLQRLMPEEEASQDTAELDTVEAE